MSETTRQLRELRQHLLRVAGLLAVVVVGLYVYREPLLQVMTRPLLDAPGAPKSLIVTGLPELFFTYVRLCVWVGLFGCAPYVMWEAWRFIRPGLYGYERRAVWPALVALPLLFYLGGIFAYVLVVPAAIAFLLSFQSAGVTALPTLHEYLGFFIGLSFAFGLTFDLPVVLVLLMRFGVVTPEALARQRRFVIVGIFIVAAILTPTPDPLTQCLLALPLWFLFELALVVGQGRGRGDSTGVS